MPVRDIYLKIEPIFDYSPVDPDPASPIPYRRDCMRNMGHEDSTIPMSEVNARTLNALVYREYLDPGYLIPKPDKIVQADVNEPPYYRRVPGALIYAAPGDRLRIHVLNGDVLPHSFHMHGLMYGIDSDGSWPFGTQSSDGRRSDEICPGDSWTYTFDVTNATIGAWPFHDHWRHIGDDVNRGLFGGLIVLAREQPFPPPFVFPPHLDAVVKGLIERPPKGIVGRPPPRPHHLTHGIDMVGHRMAGLPPAPGPGRGGLPMPDPHPQPRPIPEDVPQLIPLLEILEHLVHVPQHHPIPRPPAVLHVPLFYHFMSGPRGTPAFDSGNLSNGQQFTQTFSVAGSLDYYCQRHGAGMSGTVDVAAGGLAAAAVIIVDNQFQPPIVTVRPGGTVTWTHAGLDLHTVTEKGGTSLPSYCFNGRAFVGNTPTIEAQAGQRIRWYVFNLDLGMNWHNFHPHAQRWTFAGETVDGRSLGPAESFIVETEAPQVLLHKPGTKKPRGAQEYRLRGDFLFHCHVEMHMMQGMAGLVRSSQTVWMTPQQADEVDADRGLALDPGGNACPDLDMERCEDAGSGRWEEVPGDPEVTFMHASLLPQSTRVLYWGYTRVDQSRMWDPAVGYSIPVNQPADVAPAGTPSPETFTDLWSAGHAHLDTPDGTLLANGGFSSGNEQALLFHPATNQWELTDPTADGRFYPTTITLADGTILTLYGSGAGTSMSFEVYTPGAGWAAPVAVPPTFGYLFYPWTYILPGGDLFIAGPTGMSRRFTPAAPIVDDPAKRWPTIAGNRSTGGERGTSVILPLRPPNYEPRVLIAGGDPPAAQQTTELIDLSQPSPAWTSLPNLNVPRGFQVNSVLLPDGRVFLAGGVGGTGGPAEIFDPDDPAAGWQLGPTMTYQRGYHSAAILLSDGSVLMGGDPQGPGGPTPHERFYPGYFARPRPLLSGTPPTVSYGDTITIQTPHAPAIGEVVLIRPGAVTHGFNQSQRFVECTIAGSTAATVDAEAPPDGNVAPPGWYLLFIVTTGRIPSEGRWIRLTP